jgi:prefoldin alpha subunit
MSSSGGPATSLADALRLHKQRTMEMVATHRALQLEMDEYELLVEQIDLMKASNGKADSKNGNKVKPIETMVDLGADMFVKGEVDNDANMLVGIGMGFFLELPLDEARGVALGIVNRLREEVDKLEDQQLEAQAHIKVVSHLATLTAEAQFE